MKIFLSFLILTVASFQVKAQTLQRMAIPKGSYKLEAKGALNSAKDIAAYCVDGTRAAPTKGVNYSNLLDGDGLVYIEGIDKPVSLKDAIASGNISIEGTQWESIDVYTDYLRSDPDYAKLTEMERNEFDFILLLFEETCRNAPSLLAEIPNMAQLRIINNYPNEIRIEAITNTEFGTLGETKPSGYSKYIYSVNGNLGSVNNQTEVWIEGAKGFYLKLKSIGEYMGDIPEDQYILEELTLVVKKFQEKYNLEVTGEIDALTEQMLTNLQNNMSPVYNTELAISEFKEVRLLKGYDVDVFLNKEYSKVEFKSADDFINYLKEREVECNLEACLSVNGELNITAGCEGVSIEISTSGALKLSITNGNMTHDFEIIKGKEATNKEGCKFGGETCLSKKIEQLYKMECDGEVISISNTSIVKLSSGNSHITF